MKSTLLLETLSLYLFCQNVDDYLDQFNKYEKTFANYLRKQSASFSPQDIRLIF